MKYKITIKSIINDKVSGSSELLEKLNKYILQNSENLLKLRKDLRSIKIALKDFAAINGYIEKVEKLIDTGNTKKLKSFLSGFDTMKYEAYNKIFNNASAFLSQLNTILTLSNSKTLLEVFKIWVKYNKKLKIIVCESRPKNEGVIFASALTKSNIKAKVLTDASMSNYIEKADAVIIGADMIFKTGNIVNKTGSRNAAIICKHFNKPFIVLATKDKFVIKNSYNPTMGNAREILNRSYRNIEVYNSYFEEIEKSLITRIFTDE